MPDRFIEINRAPVLTLWAAVVAERRGYSPDEALSLAKAVAGLNAQAKGRSLGIFKPSPDRETTHADKPRPADETRVRLCGRPVPAKRTPDGMRAVIGDDLIEPEGVARYLERAFKDDYAEVRKAMVRVAERYEPGALEEAAYGLYERFRPAVASGTRGWGQKGRLDLDLLDKLAEG